MNKPMSASVRSCPQLSTTGQERTEQERTPQDSTARDGTSFSTLSRSLSLQGGRDKASEGTTPLEPGTVRLPVRVGQAEQVSRLVGRGTCSSAACLPSDFHFTHVPSGTPPHVEIALWIYDDIRLAEHMGWRA